MTEAFEVAHYIAGSVQLVYWLVAGAGLILAIWLPKIWWRKVAWAVATIAAFSYLPIRQAQETYEVVQYRKAAWAHFEKRCKENAVEKIHKTAENVKGIFVMKPRPRATEAQLRDQNWMGDPYGYSHGIDPTESMIASYLWDTDERGMAVTIETSQKGFSFVEARDAHQPKEVSQSYVRYTLDRKPQKLIEQRVADRASTYGITWEDISTPEDRKYWVAGGKFQVIDLRSDEVIAERIGYVIEPGFGAIGGGRAPWLIARDRACPPIARNASIDRLFVAKVLKPLEGDAYAK